MTGTLGTSQPSVSISNLSPSTMLTRSSSCGCGTPLVKILPHRHAYHRGAHGILLVFDVTNRESFDNLSDWLADVRQYGVEGSPMVLVGNKADCANRQVSEDEAQAFAQKLGCQYFETSAKQNKSVDDAFNALVDSCVKSRMKVPTTTTKRPLNLEEAQKLRTTKTNGGPCEC